MNKIELTRHTALYKTALLFSPSLKKTSIQTAAGSTFYKGRNPGYLGVCLCRGYVCPCVPADVCWGGGGGGG